MRLSDIKIGDKFKHFNEQSRSERIYQRIDMNPSIMFSHVQLPYSTVAALDLTTYKVVCLNGDYEVELDNNKTCKGCKHIGFRYPYASMYPCNNCRRANSKDYYNVDLKED
jgi:hypothetical protein